MLIHEGEDLEIGSCQDYARDIGAIFISGQEFSDPSNRAMFDQIILTCTEAFIKVNYNFSAQEE